MWDMWRCQATPGCKHCGRCLISTLWHGWALRSLRSKSDVLQGIEESQRCLYRLHRADYLQGGYKMRLGKHTIELVIVGEIACLYAHFDVAENDGTCYPQVSAHGRYRRHAVTVLLVCRSSKVFHSTWRCASSLTSRGVGAETAAMSKPYLAALCALPWAMSACGAASWMLPVGAALPSAYWFWTQSWEAHFRI